MATGTVKWFNPTKGYGFIQPDNGGSDVFVHITAVQKAGLQGLDENAKVEDELENQRGKTSAVDLKVLDGRRTLRVLRLKGAGPAGSAPFFLRIDGRSRLERIWVGRSGGRR